MDGIADLHTVVFEQLGQLAQGVLGLGHRQAVAGHKHDALGLLQRHGAFFRTAAGDAGVARLAASTTATATGEGTGTEGTAKQHRQQRAIHGRAHHLGEDQAGRTDHGASHDQQLAAHHKAGGGGGHPRIRIKQRDDHRHVGAADRQGDADTQQAGADHQQPQRQARWIARQQHGPHQGGHRQGDVDNVAQGALGPGGGAEPALQLGHRHNRAAEGDSSDKYRNSDRHQGHHVGAVGIKQGHTNGHQQGGQTAAAIEQGHHFGHGRHRHPQGGNNPGQATGGGAGGDPQPGHRPRTDLDQQAQHGQAHGHGRQLVGAAGGAHLGEALDAEAQQQHRHQIDAIGQQFSRHQLSPLRRNMASMRSVTRKPPTTL